MNTLLGTKKMMTQKFVGNSRIPVTVVVAGPCLVSGIKTKKKDGYWAVQLGYGERRAKNVSKPMQGHLKKTFADGKFPRNLREVRLDEEPNQKIGDEVKISDIFTLGDSVSVTSVSKGKGFAGVVKRWGFAGAPRTHGQKHTQRKGGSIGQGTTPGRVRKGKKMPGRMGTDTITIANLEVLDIDGDKNELVLKGSVAGSTGTFLVIKKTKNAKKENTELKGESVSKEEGQNK